MIRLRHTDYGLQLTDYDQPTTKKNKTRNNR